MAASIDQFFKITERGSSVKTELLGGTPTFLTIANGLTAGLILYVLIKLLSGNARQLNAGSCVLAGLCLVYYVFGMPH